MYLISVVLCQLYRRQVDGERNFIISGFHSPGYQARCSGGLFCFSPPSEKQPRRQGSTPVLVLSLSHEATVEGPRTNLPESPVRLGESVPACATSSRGRSRKGLGDALILGSLIATAHGGAFQNAIRFHRGLGICSRASACACHAAVVHLMRVVSRYR